nr:SUMF1/EgtB/PvdO family nonheme iron enzyme [Allomuricauda sp.]
MVLIFLLACQGLALSQEILEPEPPAGTLKINDTLFIDRTPVSNLMYLEFIHSLYPDSQFHERDSIQKNGAYRFSVENLEKSISTKITYPSPLIDQTKLRGYLGNRGYYTKIGLKENPVLEISRQEAELYCKWRTEMVKLLNHLNSDYQNPVKRPQLLYRLPTKTEYLMAIDYFSDLGLFVENNEKSPFKMKNNNVDEDFFIVNRISEMTRTGFIFENNWRMKDFAKTPNDYTGFRCVCIVTN